MRGGVVGVVVVVDAETATRIMIGMDAAAEVDELLAGVSELVPVCEAVGLVAFRRGRVVEFVLFEVEGVEAAASATVGG